MSELGTVLWLGFAAPPLRRVARVTSVRGRRAGRRLRRAALDLELALERRLMEPGPPRSWARAR